MMYVYKFPANSAPRITVTGVSGLRNNSVIVSHGSIIIFNL